MSQASRSTKFTRARKSMRIRLRALLRNALLAELGLAGSLATTALYAQDTTNTGTKNLIFPTIEDAPTGDYINNGILNFNGPSGSARWSAQSLVISNAGQVHLYRADLGIIGDVTNTGLFNIAQLGGIVEVDGHFTNDQNGEVRINGLGMRLIGDLGVGIADFTNNSTNALGVSINTGRFLIADTITNAAGANITSSGRLEGRNAIVNNGTIDSNATTSILHGTITNNGTINAQGTVEGNVTNSASNTFNVKGNLAQTGNFTNAGTLAVTDGNLTGTNQLTNTSTITIANNRTVSAADIKNNTGGTITVGNSSILTGSKLVNNATINVGAGGTVRSTSTTTDEDLTNSATGVISFNGATGTANLFSGTGKIVNEGTINLNEGTVLVTGNLAGAGTVAIADDVTFKTGSADQTIANAVTLVDDLTFDTNGFNATLSGNITGTSDGRLIKAGLGNLTLEGTNAFGGPTSIDAGQLTLKDGNALGDSNAVTVGAAGKLKIENAETIGSLAGAAGSETNLVEDLTTGGNNASTTYSGKIVGAGELIKNGTGTMTLSGTDPNTFSGGVTINNGTVIASTNEQLGTGAVTVGLDGNGAAGTLQVNSGKTQTVDDLDILAESGVGAPKGVVNNSGTITSTKNISNQGTINNLGTINANSGITSDGGTVNNSVSTSVINGGLDSRSGVINNAGTINGGVINTGTLNSDMGTSVIAGGLSNSGEAKLRNQVSGAIVNEDKTSLSGPVGPGLITVAGDLVGNSTLLNKETSKVHVKDGNFTGITTLTNESTDASGVQIDANRTLGAAAVVNKSGSTIANSGTLQSGSAISNSGTITNNTGATVAGGINNAQAGSLVTNDGTINGGITQNFGTVNSLQSGSVINGGVNNSAYVNARGQINGAIVNNAQHTFTDVTLTHAQANASGTVSFGTGPSSTTFNLAVANTSFGGALGNGPVTIDIVFNQTTPLAGTSTYNSSTNTIRVFVSDTSITKVQDIQTAINNGSGFTASGGSLTDPVNGNGLAALAGGRDSGTALIRVKADATGSAAQNKQVTVTEDNSIPPDSAVASVDSTTGNIVIKVNGNVSYSDIATEIDRLPGFNASVAASNGDQGYMSSLDSPPATASTLTNGVLNVEGDLVANSTFTNGGQLNVNNGDLTGVTTLTNTGEVAVKDANRLEAATVNNNAGTITLHEDSVLHSSTATNNSADLKVNRLGDITSAGTITNSASGKITFGLGSTAASDVSELKSTTNSIVNNGQIDVTKGVLLTTGNVSGTGTIAMGDGTTFRTGNDNQTIANGMTIASGSATFDTDGKNSTVSGAISGSGEFHKAGTGNLTLSGANTFTGPAVIDNGQLTLSGGSAIADATDVDLNLGSLTVSTAETIGSLETSSGTTTNLNATLSTGGNNSNTTSSGVITGTSGLVKQGTGTMTLDGSVANTHAGGTTVSGGSLVAGTNEQLGSGSVSVGPGANLTTAASTTQSVAGLNNQGTVSLGNSSTFNTGSTHFNNSGTVNVGTNANILDTGLITNSGAINFSGGMTTLSSGTNSITNTGDLNLNAGTLLVKGSVAGIGSINMNNGTILQSGNADQVIANGIKINEATALIDTNGNNVNVSGTVSGSGSLNKVATGNLTLSGTNTFTGPAVIDNGQLTLSGGSAIADATDVDLNLGSLTVSTAETIGSLETSSGTTTNLNATLTTGGNNSSTTSSGLITGAAGLVKQGTGTMTLDGSVDNTYAGGTTVSGGSLVAATNQQLGSGTVNVGTGANLTTSNSTTQTVAGLNNQGTVSLGNSSTFNTGSAHFNNSGTVDAGTGASIVGTHAINNSGAINFSGGTSTLSSGTDSITNTGDININDGTLHAKGNIAGNGSINMSNGTTLQSGSANQQIANGIKINGASALIDSNGNEVNVTGTVSGAGRLNNVGTGNVTLSGTNTFTGPAVIDNGQLTLSGGNAIADSTDVDLNSGSLTVSTAETIGSLDTLSGTTTNLNATLTTGGNNSSTTSSGVITGAAGLVKQGTGTMTLNGSVDNTYAGGTTVSGGSLVAATNQQLGSGTVNVGTGANLTTSNSTTQTVAGLNNQGTVSLGNSSTFNTGSAHFNNSGTVDAGTGASIVGTHAINNSGAINFSGGTSTLSSGTDSITNTGDININNGTLLAKGNIAGNGSINMSNGTTLQSGSANQQIANGIKINGASALIDSNGNEVNVTGTVSGAGTLNKVGAGNLTLSGTNTFAGPVEIDGGQMTLSGGNALIDSVDVDLNSGSLAISTAETIGSLDTLSGTTTILNATLSTGGNNSSTTSSGVITGAAGLVKQGTGTMTLDGSVDNTYAGGTTVSGGSLVADTNQQLGSGTVNVGTGANLTTSNSTTQTVAGLNNQGNVSLGNSSTFNTGSAHFNNSGTVDAGTGASIVGTHAINNSGAINFSGGTSTLSSGTDSITNTGDINVNDGTLLAKGNIAGNGSINMNDGTTLRSGNANQQIANGIKINGASALVDSNGNDFNVTGTVSGAGTLNKVGAGNLTLSGNNTFTGPVEIDGGQLTLSGENAIADSTEVELDSGSLLVSNAETIGSLDTLAGTQTTLNATLSTGGNNLSTTSSGVITGTAELVKQGTGTMTLDGSVANTHAGGTTVNGGALTAATNEQLGTGRVTVGTGATLNAGDNTTQSVAGLNNQGTLSLGSSATLNTGADHFLNSGTVNVGSSGSIIDSGLINNSGTINFTGGTATLSSGTNSITNTGNINLNAGTVLVKGNLSGSGSINMNDGTTLRSGNANQQIANGIAVNSGTAIIDTNGNSVNLTGTISGSGNLNKVGEGALTWVGVNHGNALVDSGVMITSTQNQVGNIQIANGSGVIFNQDAAGTYAGSVTGNGTLTKEGTGIVTLTGNSAYSGGTNVVGGTLRVGNEGTGQVQSNVNVRSSGTLGGSGTVVGDVVTDEGGRIAAGNSIGILNIAGNLNAAASVIENEMNGTLGDLINVTGIATLTGATLENQFDPTATYTTRMYRALDAAGGVSGRFSTVTQVNAPSDFLITTYYTPTTANVVLTSMADATLASSTSTSLLSSGQNYLTSIMDQVNGYQFGGLALVAGDESQPTERNLWFKGVGFFNDVDGVGAAPGYSANTGGGIAGVDYALDPSTRIGFAGGYTFSDLSMKNAALSNTEINSPRVNLYGAHSWEQITLSAVGGYAYHDVEGMRRLVGIGTALGSQTQHEASANFQFTVNPTGEIHSFLPYFGVQWVHLSQNAYTETGTPGFNMSFEEAKADSLRPYFGLRYQYQMLNPSGSTAVPYLFARYSQETITDSNLSNLSINGSSFTVAGVQPSRSIFGLGGGINAQLIQNIDWYANYNLDLGARSTNHNAAAGLGFEF